jgi:CDP-archaeol synthase
MAELLLSNQSSRAFLFRERLAGTISLSQTIMLAGIGRTSELASWRIEINRLQSTKRYLRSWSEATGHDVTGRIEMWISAHAPAIIQSLILITAANGAPVFVARALRARPALPIDGGIVLRDGRPLLGHSKTWRGLASAIVLATCAAVLIGLPWALGVFAAISAMVGDGLSSFVKRRFGLEPSSMTLGLDQIPESLLPALACAAYLPLRPIDVLVIVFAFFVGELAASRLFFAVGLRKRPY